MLGRTVLLFLLCCCTCVSAADFEVGFQVERFVPDDSKTVSSSAVRPLIVHWWYPIDASNSGNTAAAYRYPLGRGRVLENGAIVSGQHPLVILSPGAMGSSHNYSWIAERLASDGFVVAGLAHFGESFDYGPGTIEPASVLRYWRRPQDATQLLDLLALGDSRFAKHLDQEKVGFVGHSSGGATGLLLAGLSFDSNRLSEYCLSAQSALDKGCSYAREHKEPGVMEGPTTSAALSDARVRVVVALDPALGPGFVGPPSKANHASYQAQVPPIMIVGSVNNDFLPFNNHAGRIAKLFPSISLVRLEGGEGHFAYLNECDSEFAANGVSLCRDASSVDRGNVHQKVGVQVVRFLQKYLLP